MDLTIYKDNNFDQTGKLQTKTHIKTTNTFQYIHYTSHHPPATKRSVLKSELIRYKNQCTKQEDYKKLKKEYIQHFLGRGYPFKIIIQVIKEVEKGIIQKDTVETNNTVYPFIIEYDQRQKHPKKYISLHKDILLQDMSTARIYKNRSIIAYSNKKT